MDEPQPIRVALVEDDHRLRKGMAMLINASPGFSCIAEYGSVEEVIHARPPCEHPHVVLLDIHLPGVSGSEGVSRVRERFPDAVVLMLTVFEEEDLIFESLCNGADGYLLKKTPPARLLEYVREAASGGAPMSPEIARKVVRIFRQVAPPSRVEVRLSPQELRFLGFLAEGHSYASAAETMGITINTARNHVRAVYEKLHVHSKSEAVSKALRAGLI
jgi:DNA-binding NarL/FixJ family response regulator